MISGKIATGCVAADLASGRRAAIGRAPILLPPANASPSAETWLAGPFLQFRD